MDRRTFSLSAIGALVTTLTACGGGGSASEPAAGNVVPVKDTSIVVQPTAPAAELASASSLKTGTVFLQGVAATDRDPEAAPGQANFWDLRTNMALGDGYNSQFAGALNLSVTLGTDARPFPADQTYAGLTAWGPELGAADGVMAVTFPSPGPALMHPGRGVRLQKTLDLTGATGAISLVWASMYQPAPFQNSTDLESFIDAPFYWQVVLRDSAGNELKLYREDRSGITGVSIPDRITGPDGVPSTDRRANLSAYANQIVVLCFEHDSGYNAEVSSVSVKDGAGKEYVTNGSFAGARGWTVPAIKTVQNVQSAARPLHGLDVRRMFYTQPNALWGRWTDCFHNPSTTPITVTVSFDSTLGSGGRGVIYDTPGANGKALTSWDGGVPITNTTTSKIRDIGMVFGNGVVKEAQKASALAMDPPDGSANIKFTHTITVPAGGSVALVNFIIMTGTDTGRTASDASARATEVDNLAADIANNFRSNFAYQRGMMQAQLDTLINF